MQPDPTRVAHAAKRLLEAIGYLELGLIPQARGCLMDAGAPDELEPAAKMLHEEIARREGRPADDDLAVDQICLLTSEPVSEGILLSLAHGCWEAGDRQRAVEVFEYTRPPGRRRRALQGKPGSKHGSAS